MMIGERNHVNQTIHVPPWSVINNSMVGDVSFPFPVSGITVNPNVEDFPSFHLNETLTEFQRFDDGDSDSDTMGLDPPLDGYSRDHFFMFEFKIRKCARGRSHDWTECPYAHPGEKARRRDPRKYHYSGTACPEFRKGNCKKGDGCEFAHGVFECWLHPARYRTQPCKDGTNCCRRVCFFAHTAEELRVLSPRTPGSGEGYDGSPHRLAFEGSCAKGLAFLSSPESVSPPSESPPVSSLLSRSLGSNSIGEIVASLRQLQLSKVKTMPSSWSLQMGGSAFGSPRLGNTRPGFCSLPTTPTRAVTQPGIGYRDLWDKECFEEEPVMERVESGRGLRAKMFEKLSKENPLDRVDPTPSSSQGPDVGWVSELVK